MASLSSSFDSSQGYSLNSSMSLSHRPASTAPSQLSPAAFRRYSALSDYSDDDDESAGHYAPPSQTLRTMVDKTAVPFRRQYAAGSNTSDYVEVPRRQCSACSRLFALDRIDRHEQICLANADRAASRLNTTTGSSHASPMSHRSRHSPASTTLSSPAAQSPSPSQRSTPSRPSTARSTSKSAINTVVRPATAVPSSNWSSQYHSLKQGLRATQDVALVPSRSRSPLKSPGKRHSVLPVPRVPLSQSALHAVLRGHHDTQTSSEADDVESWASEETSKSDVSESVHSNFGKANLGSAWNSVRVSTSGMSQRSSRTHRSDSEFLWHTSSSDDEHVDRATNVPPPVAPAKSNSTHIPVATLIEAPRRPMSAIVQQVKQQLQSQNSQAQLAPKSVPTMASAPPHPSHSEHNLNLELREDLLLPSHRTNAAQVQPMTKRPATASATTNHATIKIASNPHSSTAANTASNTITHTTVKPTGTTKRVGKYDSIPGRAMAAASETSNYITCDHCHRRFAPKSHQRHQELCANVENRPRNQHQSPDRVVPNTIRSIKVAAPANKTLYHVRPATAPHTVPAVYHTQPASPPHSQPIRVIGVSPVMSRRKQKPQSQPPSELAANSATDLLDSWTSRGETAVQPQQWVGADAFQEKLYAARVSGVNGLSTVLSSSETLPYDSSRYAPDHQDDCVEPSQERSSIQSAASFNRSSLPAWPSSTIMHSEHTTHLEPAHSSTQSQGDPMVASLLSEVQALRAELSRLKHSAVTPAVAGSASRVMAPALGGSGVAFPSFDSLTASPLR